MTTFPNRVSRGLSQDVSITAPPASRYAAVSVQASHLTGTGTGGHNKIQRVHPRELTTGCDPHAAIAPIYGVPSHKAVHQHSAREAAQ